MPTPIPLCSSLSQACISATAYTSTFLLLDMNTQYKVNITSSTGLVFIQAIFCRTCAALVCGC